VDGGGVEGMAPEELGALAARYGLELDIDSVPGLLERFGLEPGGPAA